MHGEIRYWNDPFHHKEEEALYMDEMPLRDMAIKSFGALIINDSISKLILMCWTHRLVLVQ
jgi:hypothetical protein